MAEETRDLNQLLADLKQQREELIVQLQLGKAEAKDTLAELEKKWEQLKADPDALSGEVEATVHAEWAKLEQQLEELKAKEEPIRDTVQEVSEDVGFAVKRLGDELQRGYERLRKLF